MNASTTASFGAKPAWPVPSPPDAADSATGVHARSCWMERGPPRLPLTANPPPSVHSAYCGRSGNKKPVGGRQACLCRGHGRRTPGLRCVGTGSRADRTSANPGRSKSTPGQRRPHACRLRRQPATQGPRAKPGARGVPNLDYREITSNRPPPNISRASPFTASLVTPRKASTRLNG
ncbi:MAG: hypothetical protein ACI9WU_003736 [Myxococcota bacterium]|jgi:hypothetical protein